MNVPSAQGAHGSEGGPCATNWPRNCGITLSRSCWHFQYLIKMVTFRHALQEEDSSSFMKGLFFHIACKHQHFDNMIIFRSDDSSLTSSFIEQVCQSFDIILIKSISAFYEVPKVLLTSCFKKGSTCSY